MEKILQYNNNKYNQFLVYIKTGEEGGKNREYLEQHLQTFIDDRQRPGQAGLIPRSLSSLQNLPRLKNISRLKNI